jgi:riboflavin kinase/FMN adenylyltransferase
MVAEHNLIGGGWVEGADFRFGRGRAGDMAMLRALGVEMGFSVRVVEPVQVALGGGNPVPVSSSLVRGLIEQGRMEDAAACLGRLWTLAGPVVHGEKRGRTLGVPTANLDPKAWEGLAMPPEGVYACIAWAAGTPHPAAVSVGRKPMFGGQALAVEAHLLRFGGGPDELYGRPLTLGFGRFLRAQSVYAGVDELLKQIHADIRHTDHWFSTHGGALSCSLTGIL